MRYPAALAHGAAREGGRRRSAAGTPRRRTRSCKHALQIALEHDLVEDAGTCYFLLSDRCFRRDQYAEALGYLDEALALARQDRETGRTEWASLAERTYPLFMLGRWDEAPSRATEFTQEQIDAGGVMLSLLESAVEIHVAARRARRRAPDLRDVRAARGLHRRPGSRRATSDRAPACTGPRGGSDEALADGEATIETGRTLGDRRRRP